MQILHSKGMEAKSPTPQVWAIHSDLLPKTTAHKGRKRVQWKNLTNTSSYLSARLSKSTSTLTYHADIMYRGYGIMKMTLYFYNLPPTNPQSQYNCEKKSRHILIEGHSIIYSTSRSVLFKPIKVIRNKESLRKYHSQEESKDT